MKIIVDHVSKIIKGIDILTDISMVLRPDISLVFKV